MKKNQNKINQEIDERINGQFRVDQNKNTLLLAIRNISSITTIRGL